eukprot:TRINITY_DN10087_c0_g1_i1.p1 TRINITY_DN10087_c0_g1~~TRINITY_DN10087_c0_g1_i1.p1  ORF type:complete len:118 (-),score=43.72 TRINITY_DN10087_c0_g1_i1:123-476(-)
MIRRPPRSTQSRSSAASDVYKRQAKCYRVRDRATGNIIMAKCVPVSKENGVSRWLLREAAILWNITHPCIVKLQGALVDNDLACLFFQDCGKTNLHRMACNGDNLSLIHISEPTRPY